MTTPGDHPTYATSSIAAAIQARYARALAIPTGTPAQMAIVQARYGSNRASARAVGVDERTWRRWLTGATRPRPASAGKLAESARQVRAQAITVAFRVVHFDRHMGRDQRSGTADARALDYDRRADAHIAEHVRRQHWGRAAAAWLAGIRDDVYRYEVFDRFLDQEYGVTVTSMEM